MIFSRSTRLRLSAGLTGVAVAAVFAATAQAAGPHTATGQHHVIKPTVVIVHGAFADASGWTDVIDQLQKDGYPVLAVADPLRGLATDSAYVRSIVDTIPGPVILVGHSYGGAVITNAATGAPNVRALVYTAAYAPDAGETIAQFSNPALYPGSLLTPSALVFRPYPGGIDVTIDPAQFRQIFAADLPADKTATMAATQRPLSAATETEKSGVPAWKTIPSWYLVSADDKALSPTAERFFAKRAGSHTVEINASHVAYISHPHTVTTLIEAADHGTAH